MDEARKVLALLQSDLALEKLLKAEVDAGREEVLSDSFIDLL